MAAKASKSASVATFADHEVLMPPTNLKNRATKMKSSAAMDFDAIERAEKALQELSGEFADWMIVEADRLHAARSKVRMDGWSQKALSELFRAAHDIKGEAPTLGFILCAQIADSLCRLLEKTPTMEAIPLSLVDQHVDAIRAIVREKITDEFDSTGATLAGRLREVTEDYLVRANRDRPDILAELNAPSIAPEL